MRYFYEPTGNNPRHPCGICTKNVSYRHRAVQCDLCNYWNHIKCDGVENKTYEALKKDSVKHFRKLWKEDIFAFQTLSDDEFLTSFVKNIEIKEDLNLRITPTETLKSLFNDFSNHNEDEPTPINCGYYDLSTKIPNSSNCSHSMFHLNLASLALHKKN